MSTCNLSAINFFPPFLEVGKATTFFVDTDPPNQKVTWTITPASGVTRRTVSNNGHRIDVVWGRSGEITLTARCGSSKQSITVQVAPSPPPPPPPPPFGEPELVPEITYISNKGSKGFLQDARDFHRKWGLKPKSVDSIEAIIDDLQRSSGKLKRIRIVTHAFAFDLGPTAAASLVMSLFKGSPVGFNEKVLRAFAKSDEAGLSELTQSNDAEAISAAKRAIKRGFRKKLDRVRKRFTSSSSIDIRGCEVGQSTAYLRAVSEFFGSGTNKPHVSAPDLFQGFFIPAWEAVPGDKLSERAAELVGEAEVVKALNHWTKIANLRFDPTLPLRDRLGAYLDSYYILPVHSTSDFGIKLYMIVQSEKLPQRRWLNAQWSPALTAAAERFAKTWKGNNKAPRVAVVCESLDQNGNIDPLGSNNTLVSPDPDYKKHIKSI
jgi:hypothetical protein